MADKERENVIHAFLKNFRLKVNVRAQLKLELAYNGIKIKYIRHYATGLSDNNIVSFQQLFHQIYSNSATQKW